MLHSVLAGGSMEAARLTKILTITATPLTKAEEASVAASIKRIRSCFTFHYIYPQRCTVPASAPLVRCPLPLYPSTPLPLYPSINGVHDTYDAISSTMKKIHAQNAHVVGNLLWGRRQWRRRRRHRATWIKLQPLTATAENWHDSTAQEDDEPESIPCTIYC